MTKADVQKVFGSKDKYDKADLANLKCHDSINDKEEFIKYKEYRIFRANNTGRWFIMHGVEGYYGPANGFESKEEAKSYVDKGNMKKTFDSINDSEPEIINEHGHYAVYIDGKFIGSEDTYNEARKLAEEYEAEAKDSEKNDMKKDSIVEIPEAYSFLKSLMKEYKLDKEGKTMLGRHHMEFVGKSKIEESQFDQLAKQIMDMVDKMDDKYGTRSTFNIGLQNDDRIRAVVDIDGKHVKDSIKDDWSKGISVTAKVSTQSLLAACKNGTARIGSQSNIDASKYIGHKSLNFYVNGLSGAWLNMDRNESEIHLNMYDDEFTYKEFGGKKDFNKAKLSQGMKNLENQVVNALKSAGIKVSQSKVEIGGSSKFNSIWRQAQSYNDSKVKDDHYEMNQMAIKTVKEGMAKLGYIIESEDYDEDLGVHFQFISKQAIPEDISDADFRNQYVRPVNSLTAPLRNRYDAPTTYNMGYSNKDRKVHVGLDIQPSFIKN